MPRPVEDEGRRKQADDVRHQLTGRKRNGERRASSRKFAVIKNVCIFFFFKLPPTPLKTWCVT